MKTITSGRKSIMGMGPKGVVLLRNIASRGSTPALFNIIMLTAVTGLYVIAARGALSQEVPPQLKTYQQFTNHGRFALIPSWKDRVLIDKGAGTFSVIKGNEIIEQYREERKYTPSLDTILEERQRFYSKRAVLFSLSNVVMNGDNIVAVHRLDRDYSFVRVVQFLDRDMNVISSWSDESLPCQVDYRLGLEPFAVSGDGMTAGLGEEGEILVYSKDGQVKKSFVVKGVFNQTREARIARVDTKKNYHLSSDTLELVRMRERRSEGLVKKFMNKRDEVLEHKRIELPEFDYTNINGLFFSPDNTLNVMVGSRWLHRIDLVSGLQRVEDLSSVIGNSTIAEDGAIYQALSHGWDLYLLTRFRVVRVRMERGFVSAGETAIPKEEDTVGHWTVLAGEGRESGRRFFVEYSMSGDRVVELNAK